MTGAAVMVYEFAAPNLFRAWFGQTIHVWANVIGVILGALAAGYALGGRWADASKTLRPLATVIGFAGLYGLVVAWFGPAFCAWLAGPVEYTQDGSQQAYFIQSLAASLVLFGPPMVALGMATPLMVQRASQHWPVGTASGLIFAVGTLGSLAGIYATTYLFVEMLGVRATIRVAAGTLTLLAALLVWLGSRNKRVVAALILGAVVPVGWSAQWHLIAPAPPNATLIYAVESPYQLIRVVDRKEGKDGKVQRWLAFDEGTGTYHSMQVGSGTPWTGAYYDAFARIPEWVGAMESCRICIVGNAAGTMTDLLRMHNPLTSFEFDAVEIDPLVTDAARRTMGLVDRDDVRIFHEDGRTFLRRQAEGRYDAILMDAYARQVSIPASLATREFFALAKSRLRVGGVLFANLGALRSGGELVRTVADTMQAGFGGPVFRAPLRGTTNVLLIAARGGDAPPPPSGTRLGAVWSFGRHVPGGSVLTDDFCPVETITARDLRRDD